MIQRWPRTTASASSLQALPFDEIIQSACSSSSSSTPFLLAASDAATDVLVYDEPMLNTLLHIPTLWSVLAMTSIVALLVAWEESVENIRHNTPKPIMPVIDSMLAEVGGLGFIGLFLSTVVTGGPLGKVVGGLSEQYLGDEELLLETFEFLHTFFFQVGILFFVIAGVVVGAVLQEVQQLNEISELALDADGDGEVTLDELADALQVQSMIVDMDGDGVITEEEKTEALRATSQNTDSIQNIFDEYSMSNTDRAGEQLVIRERIIDQLNLPQTFAIEDYFAKIFGHNLEEVVELSPVTWLPLIPLIAIDNSVDLTRDVVSASSSNAFDSCGYFFATPWVLYSTIILQALSLVWAVFNFWKVSSIKKMLLPTLVKENTDSEAILLPPRYLDPYLLDRFNSSPSIFGWGEQFFTGGGSKTNPPRNAHEELFGASGAKFPSIYRNSIQSHTWLCVAQIVYSTTQIIFRDATALYIGATVGDPETVLPELILWSAFVASALFQLSLAPTTFLNYCFVTSVEEYVKKGVVKKSILDGITEEKMKEAELVKS
ncbi:hypothetical protein ACHAXR_003399 [Thalassiosira sp. AJA248-18]